MYTCSAKNISYMLIRHNNSYLSHYTHVTIVLYKHNGSHLKTRTLTRIHLSDLSGFNAMFVYCLTSFLSMISTRQLVDIPLSPNLYTTESIKPQWRSCSLSHSINNTGILLGHELSGPMYLIKDNRGMGRLHKYAPPVKAVHTSCLDF